jgi:hypothetical protein
MSENSKTTNYQPLPEEVLSKLADLACVPLEARKEFSDLIINDLLDLHFISKQPHNKKAVSDAVKQAQKLQLKIADMHPKDRERLVYQSFEDEIDCFLELARGDYKRFYRSRRRKIRPDQKRGSGRPKGEVSNPRLRQLVLNLRYSSRRKGKQFTFDKNSGEGTLTKALDLLRPYVPVGVVPNVPPRSTIETWIVKDNERNAADRARLEKQLLQVTDLDSAKRTLERLLGPVQSRRQMHIKSRTIKSTNKSNF